MTTIIGKPVALRAADWLGLAAAPTFALMTVAAAFAERGAHQAWCAAATHTSLLTGMTPMYALMSAFHLTAWLKLSFRRHAPIRARCPETHTDQLSAAYLVSERTDR
jgi:hypothetical protein